MKKPAYINGVRIYRDEKFSKGVLTMEFKKSGDKFARKINIYEDDAKALMIALNVHFTEQS